MKGYIAMLVVIIGIVMMGFGFNNNDTNIKLGLGISGAFIFLVGVIACGYVLSVNATNEGVNHVITVYNDGYYE